MAGRYQQEVMLRLQGNRAHAQAHIPTARLLMGQVMEQAAFNDLGTHRLIRQQADGALITAEKIGALARLTIHAPGTGSGTRPIRVFDDLLITGGTTETENGTRVRLPVIISHDKDMHWQAYFAHSKALGHYPGAGTYGDVFPALKTHPDYLLGGNCYQANAEGIVTSWHSAAPFIAPKGRHPANIYGSAVCCLGMRLAAFNPPWKVLCAVIDEGWLYVLISQFEPLIYPLRPAQPAQFGDVWASHYYSQDPHYLMLGRYPLKSKKLAHSQHLYYAIEADAGQVIYQGYFLRCYNRWTFDLEKRQFVTVQLPRQPILRYVRGELMEPPSHNEAIVRLGMDGTVTTELAHRVIFEDNGQQIRLEAVNGGFDYVTPTRTLPALRTHSAQTVCNAMVYAHCASDHYVLCRSLRYPYVDTVFERDEMVAWDKGQETIFSPNKPWVNTGDWDGILLDVLPHMSGSGIATLCYGAFGWVHYDETNPYASQSIVDMGRLTPWGEVNISRKGLSAGGYSVADLLHTEEASYLKDGQWVWREKVTRLRAGGPVQNTHYNEDADQVHLPQWATTGFLGDGTTPDPVFIGQSSVVINANATGHGQVLAAYRGHNSAGSDSYLTGADVNVLTGKAFDYKSFCPLGKPHRQQPRQVNV